MYTCVYIYTYEYAEENSFSWNKKYKQITTKPHPLAVRSPVNMYRMVRRYKTFLALGNFSRLGPKV